jgi:hypothetical protein
LKALAVPLQTAFLVFRLVALWRGARWGWVLSMITLGRFSFTALTAAVGAGVERQSERTVIFALLAASGALMPALLGKARHRYQAWAGGHRGTCGPGAAFRGTSRLRR